MSRDTFMVGNGFIINERAISKVGSGHNNAAGSLAVRSPGYIVSCRSGLECRYGFNRNRRFGQQVEKPWQFRLHLPDVAAEIVKNLFCRLWNVFGIRLERR